MVKKAAQAIPNQLLHQARLERGWTQKVVAERIGAPNDMMVTHWECGTAYPSVYYIERLCQLFEQCASDLGLLLEPRPMVSSHPFPGRSRRPDSSEERAHSRTGMNPSFPRLAEVEESAHEGMRMQPWRSRFRYHSPRSLAASARSRR